MIGGNTFSVASEPTYSNEYQHVLEYRVQEWNGTNGLEWYVWDFSDPIHRGFAGSEINGKIEVNITGLHNESKRLTYLSNPEPVPYGDIKFYWKNGDLNFTATNISNTEMAYVLNLGYMNWFPGFMIPLDWEENAALAIAQSNVWGILCDVRVINQTNSVVYTFKQQTGSLLQNTTLQYDTTSGALLSAYTEFGNYWCRLIPYGPIPVPPAREIPGYSILLIGIVSIVTLIGVGFIFKKNAIKTRK
jgi:hypothetical protein